MADAMQDNRDDVFDAIVCQFVEAKLCGDNPRLEDFLKRVPGREQQFREEAELCCEVDTLFDSLRKIEPQEFQDESPAEMIGRRIGAVEITDVAGGGGMGVVWKGRDTKLNRIVAVKALPAEAPDDPTWRQRLKREARILASLSHPNVGAIYDVVEREDGTDFLILEYVPGQTLAQRMEQEPLPLKEALVFAAQIAGALTAACDAGIVHRDLKPGNIKVTPAGNIKVLDFGIAKQLISSDRPADLTQQGRLVGTPAYMSPEQTRGKPVDRRTDIWSFGCVLYEMLTGRLAFKGETVTDTIAHVLEREPDWDALPAAVPQNIRVLLRRCLEKDVRHRLQHIGDAAIEISETLNPPAIAAPVSYPLISPPSAPQGNGQLTAKTHFMVPRETSYAGESLWFPSLAFSPDGRTLAYVMEGADGRRRIYIRRLQSADTTVLEGTEGAICPFFSPDGRWIGYADTFASKLKKVSLDGGVPVVLADCTGFRGGTWGSHDQIIFSSDQGSTLWRISASGSGLERVMAADPNNGRIRYLWPQIIPGGERLLFSRRADQEQGGTTVQLMDLRTGRRDVVLHGDNYTRYSRTGHLVYSDEWTLYAVRFDLENLRTEGSPVTISSRVWQSSITTSQFAISQNGAVAYVPGKWSTNKLAAVWVDQHGRRTPLPISPMNFHQAAISSDGAMLAFCAYIVNESDIWIHDVAHGSTSRLTHNGKSKCPVWSGTNVNELIYLNADEGLCRWRADQNEPVAIGRIPRLRKVSDWSHDGTQLAISTSDLDRPLRGLNISILAIDALSDTSVQRFDHSGANQRHGVFSPDDRWIAYCCDESGRPDVYVRPYPGPGAKVPVSHNGGFEPLWSADGKTLYYRRAGKMIAATVETKPEFKVLQTVELFGDDYYRCFRCKTCDIAPDGRFLMLHNEQTQDHREIHIVLNWCGAFSR